MACLYFSNKGIVAYVMWSLLCKILRTSIVCKNQQAITYLGPSEWEGFDAHPTYFGRCVNLISKKGADYAHHITNLQVLAPHPLTFSKLPTALLLYFNCMWRLQLLASTYPNYCNGPGIDLFFEIFVHTPNIIISFQSEVVSFVLLNN